MKMENYQYTAFMRYSRMKGEVEVNGRIIHYSRGGGGNRVGGGSVEARSRLNTAHAPDPERKQDRSA